MKISRQTLSIKPAKLIPVIIHLFKGLKMKKISAILIILLFNGCGDDPAVPEQTLQYHDDDDMFITQPAFLSRKCLPNT